MKKKEFIDSLKFDDKPSENLNPCQQSIWWAKKDEWEKAHNLAQKVNSKDGNWVHAYLHRLEGDIENAGYWYRLAGRPVKIKECLLKEWDEMVEYFFPTS